MMSARSKRPLRLMLCLAWCLLVWPGCGGTEPGLVPVSGKVTLNGGPWPKEGRINFTPTGAGDLLRPGGATFDTDGSFRVTSFTEADGLYPGTYQVSVDCWEVEPTIGNDGRPTPGKSPVPPKFRNPATSELNFEVKPDQQSAVAEFDVKTR